MIKRIIGPEHKNMSEHNEHWLNLDTIAQVEVTSEETAHPIESGLLPNREPGWRPRSQDPRQCVYTKRRRGDCLEVQNAAVRPVGFAGNYHEPLGIKNGACRLLDGNFSDANVSQFDLTYNE